MKLYDTLAKALKKEPNFFSDNGDVKKWVVVNKAQSCDPELLSLLLMNKELKAKFFVKVKDVFVFNQSLFVQFLEQKNYLNDSYTEYGNKIGLTIGSKYLIQRNEIALDWPFKDCVLEGGQTKEEDSREEIFFNQVLAQDEITQLLEPKILTNALRVTKDGEKKFDGFRVNEVGQIMDNIILRGNNLLALHSLKERFFGRVKLIYIDPPYNTGSDSFKYNDNFTNSTWLTFMFNRFQAAKKLLDKSGVILVQINDHNTAYLKILMDEVFGADNFINLITVRTKSPSGFKTVNLGLFESAEYILMYGASKSHFKYNPQFVASGYDTNYTGYVENIEDKPSKWIVDDIRKILCRENGIDPDKTHQPYSRLQKMIGDAVYLKKMEDFALKNAASVFRLTAIGDDAGQDTLRVKEKSERKPGKVFEVERAGNGNRYILDGQEMAFYAKKIRTIDGVESPTTMLTNIWTDISWEGIASEGGVMLKKGKKPEKLLRRIIEMTTGKEDIVLDYHLGSGTTAAVAHKLGRRYIGIEQLEYGKNDSSVRLKNVIAGDSTGISKAINWKGGGEYVYLELKKFNQDFIERIGSAKDKKSILAIWEDMKSKSFLNYNVDIKKQNEQIEEFSKLSLQNQKKILVELLDKNQLYVNVSSLNDKDFDVKEDERMVTNSFYRLKTSNT